MNIQHLFWETSFEDEYTIIEHGSLEKHHTRLKIQRTPDYNIVMIAYGTKDSIQMDKKDELPRGKLIKLSDENTIKAESQSNILTINRWTITNVTTHNFTEVETTCEVYSATVFPKYGEYSCAYTQYWFLNGTRDLLYSRARSVESTTEFSIEYHGHIKDVFKRKGSSQTTRNGVLLKIYGKTVLFGYNENKENEKNSGSFIRVEGDSLDESQILLVINALSLILGLVFVPIGYSTYDTNHNLIGSRYKTSSKHNIDEIKRYEQTTLIPITHSAASTEMWAKIEYILSDYIEKYIKHQSKYNLSLITHYINEAKGLPLELKMLPLAASFDMLQKAWFNSERSKSKGRYLEEMDYLATIKEHYEAIETAMNAKYDKDKVTPIMKRIKNANYLSETQKNEYLLNEIGLICGEVEKNALKKRNPIIHGDISMTAQETLDIYYAYYTLITRAIFKIIEFEIDYIDYSSYHRPLVSFQSPLGGPNDDGNPGQY